MRNINPADKRVRVLATAVDAEDGVKSVMYVALDPANTRTATILHTTGYLGWELMIDGSTHGTHKKAEAVRLAAAWVAEATLPKVYR